MKLKTVTLTYVENVVIISEHPRSFPGSSESGIECYDTKEEAIARVSSLNEKLSEDDEVFVIATFYDKMLLDSYQTYKRLIEDCRATKEKLNGQT